MPTLPNSDVIVCLPTYNEVESIGLMIDGIRALNLELFISDGNSTDGTLEIAAKKGIPVYQRADKGFGKGYGAAIRNAVEVAGDLKYAHLVILDCDTTYPVDRIPDLIAKLPEYDLVVGARHFPDISWSHRLANQLHTLAANLFHGARIQDINSGMRAFKVAKFRGLLNAKNMGLVAQMTCLGLRNNYKLLDIPVRYGKRLGTSKIDILDFFVILWRIIYERFRDRVEPGKTILDEVLKP